jgi:hypothetical protein
VDNFERMQFKTKAHELPSTQSTGWTGSKKEADKEESHLKDQIAITAHGAS